MNQTEENSGLQNTHEYIEDGATGIEAEESHSTEVITQPFDPTQIRVEPKLMTIDLIVARILENEIDLTPGFQRQAGIWNDGAQSRLIESMLIRIPLPAFYMDATDDDNWLVIDGLQRLSTIKRFIIDNDLNLCELEFLTQHHDKIYNDLPRNFQRRILETQITVYLIEKGTPPEVKYNIFKRINTGGLPLSAQEIRHALNQGNVTQLLAELAASTSFKKATDYGIRDQRMAARECILRFLAFNLTPYSEYVVPDLDGFLNKAMENINKKTGAELGELKKQFFRAVEAAYKIFGRYAFRKMFKKSGRQYPINKALFEIWTVNLNKLSDEQLRLLCEEKKDLLIDKFISLINNYPKFVSAISTGTGSVERVWFRFIAIENIIQKVLNNA